MRGQPVAPRTLGRWLDVLATALRRRHWHPVVVSRLSGCSPFGMALMPSELPSACLSLDGLGLIGWLRLATCLPWLVCLLCSWLASFIGWLLPRRSRRRAASAATSRCRPPGPHTRFQGAAELRQGVDPRNASATLDLADGGAVQAGEKAELFLGEPGSLAGREQVGAEAFGDGAHHSPSRDSKRRAARLGPMRPPRR